MSNFWQTALLAMGEVRKMNKAPLPKPGPPTADSAALSKARKRSILEQQKRSGRASTILTDTERLGS